METAETVTWLDGNHEPTQNQVHWKKKSPAEIINTKTSGIRLIEKQTGSFPWVLSLIFLLHFFAVYNTRASRRRMTPPQNKPRAHKPSETQQEIANH